jgi:transcriptional regulator with XRE-family HTH domain
VDCDFCQIEMNSHQQAGGKPLRNVAKKISEDRDQKKPTPVDEYVGIALRSRRNELGLSQTDLAKAIGVTFQQVQKYEKGTNRIGAGRLSAISQALQVPITYFFQAINGSDGPNVRPRSLELLRLPGALALLRHFSKIENPAHRMSLLELAGALAVHEKDT